MRRFSGLPLEELGETQASLARVMQKHGDDRTFETIQRNLRRMASGEARVSGEMRVLLNFTLRGKKRREAAELQKKAARPE